MNFSLRLSPAAPADPHSFAHRGLSALSINHLSLKVSGISQLIDMNSLLKYASLKPLPLIIHTSTPTLSISPLPESQRNQKKAALVYFLKQINYLPPLLPIIVVNKPPQPLDTDWQWPSNKIQAICPAIEMTNPSPKEPTVQETEPEKSTQKKLQGNRFKEAVFFKTSKNKNQESRKRCHPYFDFDVKLAEPPKKRARLASYPDKTSPSLVESENKGIYPFVEVTNPSPKGSTVKETELEKSTQKKSQNKIFEKDLSFHILEKKSQELSIFQKSKKRCNSYSVSELEQPPRKRAKLAPNPDLDKTRTSLIESENKGIYPFIETTHPFLEKSTVTETKSEKAPREKSQNTKCEIDYFFNVSKKCQASTKFQKSRKSSDSYSGSELLEPPKKHAKLAYNLYPDKTETLLNEPENDIVYPSLEKFSVTEKEPEKPTQIESQSITFKTRFFPKISMEFRESRKRRNPYSDSALAESPKKPATLASIPAPNEIGTPLIEPENKDKQSIKYDDYRVETTTEKWPGAELSNSEPSETETAIESDWCYLLAAYGYDTQRYPLLTQLPDDCHWGKRILRDFKPEYTFWLDNEEKSMLWGVRHYPVLAEFFQIDPLTYQHPYLEQAINAYTAPTESPSCSANPVAVAPPHLWQPQTYQPHPLTVY